MSETTEEKTEPSEAPEPLFLDKAPRMSIQDKQNIKKANSVSEDPNIIKVLSSPKSAYSRESYFRTGWIAKRSLFPVKKISGIEEGLTEATKYDVVIINSGSVDGVKVGDTYAVLGVGDQVKNPETGKDIGFVLCIKGIAEVIELTAQNARCRITDNFSPIETGDMVNPFKAPDIPKFDAWIKPGTKIGGYIIAVNDPLISIHLNDIIYINKGIGDGVKAGDRFYVYDYKAKQTDDYQEPIGEIQAVNVMTNETAAVVVSLKDTNIAVGSRVELVARCRYIDK
jgi:hypothetical protein